MTEEQLTATFVSDLEKVEHLQNNDLFMISQDDGDGFVSKSLEYSTLCSKVLADVDDRVDARVAEHIDELSGNIAKLSSDVKSISSVVEQNVSATIKIANCVKKAKEDIAEHQAIFDGISGINGIAIDKTNAHNWKIKHTNSVVAVTSPTFAKIKYDAQGHVTGKSNVTLADLTATGGGNLLTGAGQGLSVQNGIVALSSAGSNQLGGIKLGYSQSGKNYPLTVDTDGKAYTNVPYPEYTAGVGLVKTAANQFYLSSAGSSTIGGIKVNGNNLQLLASGVLSARGYQAATTSKLGLVRLNDDFDGGKTANIGRNYPLQLSTENGYAFVNVPWTDTLPPSIGGGQIDTASGTDVISSIVFSNGQIIQLKTSSKLKMLIDEVSAKVGNTSTETCFKVGNGTITKDGNTISFFAGSPVDTNFIDSITLDSPIQDSSIETVGRIPDGEGIFHNIDGLFLKIRTSDSVDDDIYVNLSALAVDNNLSNDNKVLTQNNMQIVNSLPSSPKDNTFYFKVD